MQAVIILGLVGLIYSAIASIIATVFTGTIEYQQRSIARTEQMFNDINFAINDIILTKNIDLTDVRYDDLEGDLLSNTAGMTDFSGLVGIIPWTSEELTVDPWGGSIQVITAMAVNPFTIVYADPTVGNASVADNIVEAPIQSFAIISNGPNGVLDTVIAGSPDYRGILNIEKLAGSDDIIHTFSTRQAMSNIWKNIYSDIENKIIPTIEDNYKQQTQKFLPVIVNAYNDLLLNAQAGEADNFINSWQNYGTIAAAAVPLSGFTSADMQAYIGGAVLPIDSVTYYYPTLSGETLQTLGLESDILTWNPFNLVLTPQNTTPVTEAEIGDNSKMLTIDVTLPIAGGTAVGEWDINFKVTIQGE